MVASFSTNIKNKRVSIFGDQHSPGVVRETAGRGGQGHHESMTQRCKKLFFSPSPLEANFPSPFRLLCCQGGSFGVCVYY